MVDMHTNVSATWKAVQFLHVNVSSAWKQVVVGHVKVSGVWKEFLNHCSPGVTTNYGASDTQAEPTATEAAVRYGTDGVRQKYEDNNNVYAGTDQYIGSCAASEYDHRWTQVSGTDGSFSIAINVWAQCSVTALALTMSEQDEGSYTRSVNFELRRRSDSVTVSSIVVTVSLTVQPP